MLQTRYLLICMLNLSCISIACGQYQNAGIKGEITDAQNNPLLAASVFLLKGQDSAVVKLAITDQHGMFSFSDVTAGKYLIKATLVGYKAITTAAFDLKSGINFNAGAINLAANTIKLAEVAVNNNNHFTDALPGLITLNVRNNILSAGSNVIEILKRAPGVQVDNSDNISLNGRSDVLVMIDNKPTYLSGQALADLLGGMPASMIDKIELISNPNSSFDAAGTGGVINIKQKKDRGTGTNVQVINSMGLYQPGGNRSSEVKLNTGFNFNHHTGRINIFGGYAYNSAPIDRSSSSDRLVTYLNELDQINVNWFSQQRRQINNYRLGVDYSINPKHILGFLVNGSVSNLSANKNTSSLISTLGVIDSTILTKSNLQKKLSNLMLNVNYRGDFSRGGQLTIDADYSNYIRHSTELIQSEYTKDDDKSAYRFLTLQNTSPSEFDLYTFNATYQLKISLTNRIAAGFKASYVKTDNNSDFGQLINGTYHADTLFTNQFKYTERINSAYINYNHLFSKKMGLEIGTRVEQTISDGLSPDQKENISSNYFDIFPNVQLNNTISANHQLLFTYSRRITRPRYEDLNPFLSYIDQYTYQIGTPYLRPFYSNTFELTHIYKEKLTTVLSFALINRFTQVVYTQNNNSQIVTLSKMNLGDRYNYGIHLMTPIAFNNYYSVDFDLSMLYQHFSNLSSGGSLDSGSPDVTLKTTHYLKLPLNFRLELFGLYETATTFGIFRYKPNYYFNAGLSKGLFKKQATVSLRVDDVFNTDKNIYTSYYQNLNIGGNQKNSFRLVQLSFSFVFGSRSVKPVRRRSTGDEDEQGRAGAN